MRGTACGRRRRREAACAGCGDRGTVIAPGATGQAAPADGSTGEVKAPPRQAWASAIVAAALGWRVILAPARGSALAPGQARSTVSATLPWLLA